MKGKRCPKRRRQCAVIISILLCKAVFFIVPTSLSVLKSAKSRESRQISSEDSEAGRRVNKRSDGKAVKPGLQERRWECTVDDVSLSRRPADRVSSLRGQDLSAKCQSIQPGWHVHTPDGGKTAEYARLFIVPQRLRSGILLSFSHMPSFVVWLDPSEREG